MEINFSKNNQNLEELSKKIQNFFVSKSRWVLVFVASLCLIYSGYLWYVYIANPRWSDSQKQEYMNTKQGAVVFDQAKFDSIVSEIGRRKSEYGKSENPPDIFRLKQ